MSKNYQFKTHCKDDSHISWLAYIFYKTVHICHKWVHNIIMPDNFFCQPVHESRSSADTPKIVISKKLAVSPLQYCRLYHATLDTMYRHCGYQIWFMLLVTVQHINLMPAGSVCIYNVQHKQTKPSSEQNCSITYILGIVTMTKKHFTMQAGHHL